MKYISARYGINHEPMNLNSAVEAGRVPYIHPSIHIRQPTSQIRSDQIRSIKIPMTMEARGRRDRIYTRPCTLSWKYIYLYSPCSRAVPLHCSVSGRRGVSQKKERESKKSNYEVDYQMKRVGKKPPPPPFPFLPSCKLRLLLSWDTQYAMPAQAI